MKIIIVDNENLEKSFIELPVQLIYKNDANYIRPLDKDIQEVFDKKKNKFFRHGVCERWILEHEGKYIGRLAVFVNKKYVQEQPTGGIGFFECIHDQKAAHFLFDQAKEWLSKQGMVAMDGPINFGERDRWWGLLVNGFEEPLYCMNYNPPYYQELFESYGFQVYFNQLCFGMDVSTPLSEKMVKWHDYYSKHPDFSVKHIEVNKLESFAEDFCTIYNKAWAKHGGGKTMELKQAKLLFYSMKQVIDEKIAWFVYHKDEPIAMWINIPDLNQYFKHFKGKFGFLQKMYFLYLKLTGACKRFVGIVYGVVPEWQGKGTDAYMIGECGKMVQPNRLYDKYEMQWIGDFNPKMVNLAHNLEAIEVRRLSTYRYLFDRNKEFKRHPML
ncbi:MAG TPA: hypothetical protein PKA54_08565 [Chitinophagaceae bacterium]|nr:MAG: hypothetical protein UZ11_BCD004001638 [Bacteroidetes bacterium OLB11]HMN33412.1 hypothetical protein [Chitinophagaceae bacterium]